MTIISEAYNAILGSNKPEAKNFQRWITHDVLPSIRKTSAYVAQNLGMETVTTPCGDVLSSPQP